MSRVQVNGVDLHHDRRGSGEPLLWITGLAISAAIFEPILSLYTDRFTCITYDNRSAGRSAVTVRPVTMPRLADDAAGLLDALGVESAHVLGISMGGMVAQELAIRHPQRVRGLVLGGTTPGGALAGPPLGRDARALAARWTRFSQEARVRELSRALFSPRFRRDHPERALELARTLALHPTTPWGYLQHWTASALHDTTLRLPLVQAPTLVLHGGDDGLVPVASADLLAERIPDAELALVPGAGHAYFLEQPEESATLLLEWLDRREPIAPGHPHGPAEQADAVLSGALRLGGGLARARRRSALRLIGRGD